MYYVYLIRSDKLEKNYVGHTDDLKKRVNEHKNGESKWTKRADDWRLVYYEAYTSRELATNRESKLKNHARGYQELVKRVFERSGEG
jgi:putative endonuclease